MSSTNKTSLGLNLWEASDKPVRQDFVNDNTIIDENITKINSNLNNLIEYGENSNGKYYKFSDGTLICESVRTFTSIPITNPWGVLFESTSTVNYGNFPYPFVSAPSTPTATCVSTTSVFIQQLNNTTATAWGQSYLVRPGSIILANTTIGLRAIGRWK